MDEPSHSGTKAEGADEIVVATSVKLNPPWRQVIISLVLLLAWTLWLYRGTAEAVVNIWSRSETFTHGFLVVPIVLWLVWRERKKLANRPPQPSSAALILVALVAFAWLMGELVAVNAVTQLALVTLLVLAVPALLGFAIAGQILFPLTFMYFAVPIGEFFMPQLMEWTADFTVAALRISGIPVFREGLQFVIPSGNWSVVEACSGIRYLIASMTVGTLFAYLNYRSTHKRVLFFLVSILVPIFANWFRAYMIVMLGHLSNNRLAAGVDHLIYGWVFFGIVIMLMFIIGARWADPEAVENIDRQESSSTLALSAGGQKHWFVVASFAVLVTLPHLLEWTIHKGESSASVVFEGPLGASGDWKMISSPLIGYKPSFQNPSTESNDEFESQGRQVGLYLGYYRNQNFDRKLVSSNNVLVASEGARWAQISLSKRIVEMEGQSVALRTAELRTASLGDVSNLARLTVWQVYWINGQLTSSDYMAKVYSAFFRLLGRGDESAVIVLYAPLVPNGDAVLSSFVSDNAGAIRAHLVRAGQRR
jgi:exosortase A